MSTSNNARRTPNVICVRADDLINGRVEIPENAAVIDARPPAARDEEPLPGEWDVIHSYTDEEALAEGVLIRAPHPQVAVYGVPVGKVTRTVVAESFRRAGMPMIEGARPAALAQEVELIAEIAEPTPDRPDGYLLISRHPELGVHWLVMASDGTYTLMRPSDY